MEVAATRGVVGSVLTMLEGGATHVGVATDHIVESFRNELWRRLQDERGHGPRAARAVPGARGRAARARRDGVGDGGARSRRRPGERGRGRGRRRRGSSRRSSAPPTRTSASAWSATGSCSSTGAAAWCATRPASSRSSACRPSRSRTGSRWSATAPTGSRGCPAGARSRPRPCSRTTSSSRRSPTLAKDWDVDVRGAVKLATDARRAPGRGGAVQGAGDAARRRGRRRRSTTGAGPAPTDDFEEWCERLRRHGHRWTGPSGSPSRGAERHHEQPERGARRRAPGTAGDAASR